LLGSAASILGCFAVAEFVRIRFQLSLRILFTSLTFCALVLSALGPRFISARSQLRTVERIRQGGGHVSYSRRDDLGGGWTRTDGGWMIPESMYHALGRDYFDDVNDVYFGKDRVSADALVSIATEGFQHLSFDEVPLDASTIARIAALSELRSLRFWNTDLDDADIEQLTRLPELEVLCLANNLQMTERGLAALSRFPKLEVLLIPSTRFRESWWEPLANIPNLKQLVLSNTTVKDSELAGISKLRNLRALSLADTSITDESVAHLSTLSNLKSVNLTGTRITEGGFSKLRSALPSCEIVR